MDTLSYLYNKLGSINYRTEREGTEERERDLEGARERVMR